MESKAVYTPVRRLTVNEIRVLVNKGILVSPENAQVLIDEIDRLRAAFDIAKRALAEEGIVLHNLPGKPQ